MSDTAAPRCEVRTVTGRCLTPFGGAACALAVNLESFADREQVYETLRGIDGVELLEEPTEAFWGGGFSWRDPEGNIWDVAWAKDASFDDRGVRFP